LLSGVALGAVLCADPPAQAMTIDVTYAASTPAAVQTDFNSLVSLYDSRFSNPIAANVTVGLTPTCGLGCSSTFRGSVSYGTWRTAMAADAAANPSNTILAAAVASLPAANPLGNGKVLVRTANLNALGFGPLVPIDTNLTFSSTQPYSFGGVAAPGAFTFKDVAAHELDEALGIGSTLTGLVNNAPLPTSFEAETISATTLA
jgi:hypothetical protein